MILIALLTTLSGAAAVYLGSPNRGWWRAAPRRPLAWSGLAACTLGAAAWTVALGPLGGGFAWLTALMLAWVVLPYLAALRMPGR